jgi:tRNA nucleotidyltransferase (CCA-adding enzyme)
LIGLSFSVPTSPRPLANVTHDRVDRRRTGWIDARRGRHRYGDAIGETDTLSPAAREPDAMSEEGHDELDAVLAAVEQRVTPDAEERTAMAEAAALLTERVESVLADLPVEADVLQVGSTARGTWLAGDRDIDLFVQFAPALDREDLEQYGLEVGRRVLPGGHEEYAEHPYVTGEFRGFDVDLVPCFAVEDATAIQSAVDRTPFHNAYLEGRLDPQLRGDVRVFKRFLKGIGAYGSDLRTRGFSGFLTELLVLEAGGVRPLLEAVADWRPPIRFDPEAHGTATFEDPLVMIDPTDPERNVAAVLSAENLARLQHYARELLADPREELFVDSEPDPLDAAAVRKHVTERATTPLAVVFDAPDLVDDQLYPQLRRSLNGITTELSRRGFSVLRSATVADERAVLLVELDVAELPAIERHEGPPVAAREHATGFYRKYADDESVYGPFLADDRYVVERPREFTTARQLLESEAIFDVALGAQVETSLEAGYEVLGAARLPELAAAFGAALARYFEPVP